MNTRMITRSENTPTFSHCPPAYVTVRADNSPRTKPPSAAPFTLPIPPSTAAVLGGIGNVTGAALGGFVLGLLSALTVTYFGGQWENVGVFSLLVVILVFKPTGLLGQQVGEKA